MSEWGDTKRGGAEREKSGWTRKWATLGEEAAGRRARWRVRAGDGGARAHLSGDPSAVSSSSMSSSSSPASPAAGASSSAARSSRPCASSSPISRPTPRSASMASSSSSSSFDVSLSTAGSTVASVDAPTFISASPSASAGLTIIFAARRGQQPKRGHPPLLLLDRAPPIAQSRVLSGRTTGVECDRASGARAPERTRIER